jgi:hypothetical protein
MKSGINFLLCALLLLSVIACKKDDDDVTPASITGTWRLTDIHSENGQIAFDFLGTPITGPYEFHGINYDATTTFTENPNAFVSQGEYTAAAYYEILGSGVSDTLTADVDATGSWFVNGDKISQVINGDTTTLDILELTGSKLRLRLLLNESYLDGGTLYSQTGEVYSTFEKQ